MTSRLTLKIWYVNAMWFWQIVKYFRGQNRVQTMWREQSPNIQSIDFQQSVPRQFNVGKNIFNK